MFSCFIKNRCFVTGQLHGIIQRNDFAILRTAGVKCVLRFRYTDADGEDATKAQIIAHIDQLMAVTIPNQDVISSVSAGFIGQYGE